MPLQTTRRRIIQVLTLGPVGAFLSACLSQNAPTTAPGAGAVASPTAGGVGQITQQPSVTLKMQSTWALRDIFHEVFVDWGKKVEEVSGGRLKIDILPSGSVAGAFQLIDAVHSGTLDGGHGVPAYWFNKDRAVSLFGTGPSFGMDADGWLGWVYYGGGQELYNDLIQRKLRLNVISFFHGPMPNQPLGWFRDEIKGPDDFRGMKFRTVGLAQDVYQAHGASVVALPGPDVVPALERGVIDAAEFNNTTSDTVYGFPDVRKVLMTQSYHQPTEFLELLVNKSKFDSLSPDFRAIIKWCTIAQSADMQWKFYDRNSKDYQALLQRGIKIIKEPKSVADAQLKAFQAIIDKDSASNPEFAKIIASQKDWAKRIVPWRDAINIPMPDMNGYRFYFGG